MRQLFLVLTATACLAACSSTEVVSGPVDGTIGQQLIELKRARDAGAINQSQYEEQRTKLVKSVK